MVVQLDHITGVNQYITSIMYISIVLVVWITNSPFLLILKRRLELIFFSYQFSVRSHGVSISLKLYGSFLT